MHLKISFEKWRPFCLGLNALIIHYSGVIMGAMVSQITSLTILYSTVYSGADQRKYQSSASLASVRGIHRWPVNSPHKWPVTRKMFPFVDVIILALRHSSSHTIDKTKQNKQNRPRAYPQGLYSIDITMHHIVSLSLAIHIGRIFIRE